MAHLHPSDPSVLLARSRRDVVYRVMFQPGDRNTPVILVGREYQSLLLYCQFRGEGWISSFPLFGVVQPHWVATVRRDASRRSSVCPSELIEEWLIACRSNDRLINCKAFSFRGDVTGNGGSGPPSIYGFLATGIQRLCPGIIFSREIDGEHLLKTFYLQFFFFFSSFDKLSINRKPKDSCDPNKKINTIL